MLGMNYAFSIKTEGINIFEIYPSFHPTINNIVDTSAISSKILNNSRVCSIYYPPSYYDNTLKKYPVLFMHDGQNLFEDAKSAFGAWKIQDTLNLLISQGDIKELIVVGIWNTANRNT
jgi:enterochelin esterase-like enzyme